MPDLTPEEQAEYDAFYADQGSGIVSSPIHKTARNPRPRSEGLKRYADGARAANVVCDRRSRNVLAVVLGSNAVMTTEGASEKLGEDFWADCRCGISHAIDGDLLLRAVLDLPERRRSTRPPTIWLRHVERRDLAT